MKTFALKLLILLLIVGVCSFYLNSFERKPTTDNETSGLYTWLIKTMNLQELAVGFLWMKFDNDTIYLLANHHRLLINLDAITTIKPDEFEAWSLKNFMRSSRAITAKDTEMKQRALRDFSRACKLNPDESKYFHDAAQTIFGKLKEPELALPYAEKAVTMDDVEPKSFRLLGLLYYELGKYEKSLSAYETLLAKNEISESDKNIATTMIAQIRHLLDSKE
jgi:tetratricopeptide (TPR) repeat protein